MKSNLTFCKDGLGSKCQKKKQTSDFGLFSKPVENFEIIFQVKSIVGEKKKPEIVLNNAAGLVLIHCDFFF
jgi:hypothetical protein